MKIIIFVFGILAISPSSFSQDKSVTVHLSDEAAKVVGESLRKEELDGNKLLS